MILLGIDFETVDLSMKPESVIEIGMVLWSTERKVPLRMESLLVRPGISITPESTAINGIDEEMVNCYGVNLDHVVSCIDCRLILYSPSYIIAHNGNAFDKHIFNAMIKSDSKWIDTMTDIPYPAHITTRKLSHLACEHGFINPFPHRAVTDVLTMLEILSMYDIDEVVKIATAPKIKIKLDVFYDNRHVAKNLGYAWDGKNKIWWKQVPDFKLDSEIIVAKRNGCGVFVNGKSL